MLSMKDGGLHCFLFCFDKWVHEYYIKQNYQLEKQKQIESPVYIGRFVFSMNVISREDNFYGKY